MESKSTKYATLVIGVTLFLMANASSAEILTKEAFNKAHMQYIKIDTISSTDQTTPSGAREELIRKAGEKSADIIVFSSGNTDKKLHVSASVYKKK